MTYAEALQFLYQRLPMYHRKGPPAYKPGLDNIRFLMDLLNHPEKNQKFIHVAGTNGKGSTSHMLASVLMEAGYKTGLFTSPHLVDFRERIKINGKPISKKTVTSFVEQWKKEITNLQPSFFEWTTALALWWFKKKKTDINVIEVGMGGRLDSTNIIVPELSIITSISFDHMQFLGDTLGKIAGEKAGIIKSRVPVIISYTQKEVAPVFRNKAREMNAPLYFADTFYKVLEKKNSPKGLQFRLKVPTPEGEKTFLCGLSGFYQEKNLPGVLMAADILNKQGNFRISTKHLRDGLRKVIPNTGLMGRWQKVSENPDIILDTAHNEGGIYEVVQQAMALKKKNVWWIFGVVQDKDLNRIFTHLPLHWNYLLVKPEVERGMDADLLLYQFNQRGYRAQCFENITRAFKTALHHADTDDLILIGGSIFLIGDFLKKSSRLLQKLI